MISGCKTLGDVRRALANAIKLGELERISEIVDALRARGWGRIAPFDYADLFTFARRAEPSLTLAAWDELLASVDELDPDGAPRARIIARVR
ncbi:MAG TPA: hypothetical protein VFO62_00435 [Candidatus Binatia bacterium]|nr:hypothetical protein [Candidatus Binatia bacterium]